MEWMRWIHAFTKGRVQWNIKTPAFNLNLARWIHFIRRWLRHHASASADYGEIYLKKHCIKTREFFFRKRNTFIFIFFHKHKLSIVWNWFIVKIILIFAKIFALRQLKWRQITLSVPGLNRGLSSNVRCLRSENYGKFTKESVIYWKKACFNKNVYKWAKNRFATSNLSRKNNLETHRLSGKEKIQSAAISKEGDGDNHLGYERTYPNWIPPKICDCKLCFLLQTLLAEFT